MKTAILNLSLFFLSACAFSTYAQKPGKTMISGKVISTEKEVVDFATVYLKGTGHGGITNQEGIYHVSAPAGNYTLVVSAVGYKTVEKPVTLLRGQRVRQNITISPETQQLDEVAAQRATGEAEHNNQSRNPAVGRSDGSVDGGKPPQAFGVQCCGSGYEGIAEYNQEPE